MYNIGTNRYCEEFKTKIYYILLDRYFTAVFTFKFTANNNSLRLFFIENSLFFVIEYLMETVLFYTLSVSINLFH